MTSAAPISPVKPLAALFSFSMLNALRSAAGLALLFLYLRYVPPREYGALAAIGVGAGIFGLLANLKLDAAMRTFYYDCHEDPGRLHQYVRQIFSASLCSACLLFAAALLGGNFLFGSLFSHADIEFFPAGVLAFATAGIGACLTSYFAYLRCSMRLAELAAWQMSLFAGTLVLQTFFLAVLALGLYGVLLGALLPALATLLSLCALKRGLLIGVPDLRALGPSFRYAAPLVAVGAVYALGTRLDRLVLEHYVTLDDLGAYAALCGLFGLLGVVLDAVDNTLRPHLHAALTEDADRSLLERYQLLYLLAGLAALAGAVLLGTQLHHVTANPMYLAVRQWLVLAAVAFAPSILTRYYALFYELRKRSKDLGVASVMRVALLAGVLLLWVPAFGIRGALIALLVAESSNAVLFGWTAWRKLGVPTRFRVVGAPLLAYLAVLWAAGLTMERM